MKTLQDAVTAQHNRFSGKRKFEKPDFDRWLGDYDVSGHRCLFNFIPFFFLSTKHIQRIQP